MDSFAWEENLPENCPPEDSFKPDHQNFFRLVENFPPLPSDFYSSEKQSPNRKFRIYNEECIIKSCSIFSSLDACKKIKKTCKRFRDSLVVSLILPPESGLICQTFSDPGHYSWWKSKVFDPIPLCVQINEND